MNGKALLLLFLLIIIVLIFLSVIKYKSFQKNSILITPLSITTPTNKPLPTITPKPSITPTFTPIPTPTVSPTPTPVPVTLEELENLFTKYANYYSVSKDLIKRIAYCESKYNTNAEYGDYLGMFQFSTNTWVNNRNLMAMDNNPSLRTNPDESIKTASFIISRNGQNSWPNCSK